MNASQVSHPTDKILHAYGLGKLDDASAETVNVHLEGCPDCRQRVAALSSDSFLGRLRDAKARPESLHLAVSSTDGLSMLGSAPGMAAPPPVSSLPPGLVDHPDYEVLRELGQGGMGVVYLAQNKLMGRLEVLKVVSGQLINRRGVLDRFLGEIRNAAQLHHPNVVTAYSVLRLGESIALAMEYVEGLDLARLVKARGPLPVANACNYVHQAALGLQHAHEHGMVHRDIKPANLMLTRQGSLAVIKVLDFGLAKVRARGRGWRADARGPDARHARLHRTRANQRCPRADIRADIYSLGCTLYYLLTGETAVHGRQPLRHPARRTTRWRRAAEPGASGGPGELAAVVAKMMAKEPERRFQEPKQVAQALMPFFKKGSAGSVGPKPEISRPDQANAGRPVSTPAQPAADAGRSAARAEETPKPTAAETQWESLIDFREEERPKIRHRPSMLSNGHRGRNGRSPWQGPFSG